MAQFHQLKVIDLQKTIRDAVVVTLEPQIEANFDFVQGQYLTFRRDFEGQEVRRSYSICSGRNEGRLQVGIKRVNGGAFSTWANSELKVGDHLEAMVPMGNFHAVPSVSDPHNLAFAGGSGITPILSILKTGLANEITSRFTLVYANRKNNTIMFREELEDLKNLYMGRLSIIHILEDESQEIDLFLGRVDSQKCELLFANWIDVTSVSMAYICGPEPMMLTIAEALKGKGLSKDQIRFELFSSAQPGRAKATSISVNNVEKGISGRVTLNGETRNLIVPPKTSLLQAALQNNIDVPFACCAGVCSTCKAKLVEGEVEMIANHSLEDYEVEAGFVLTCQSYVASDKVVWDYDQAGH